MKSNISATQIVRDFNRRGIAPDFIHEVSQGTLNIWLFCNRFIPELHIGKTIITGKYSYTNTLTPQDIADDLMTENNLGEKEISIIDAIGTEIMTFAEATQKWGLGESTLRSMARDGRLTEGIDYRKSGKVWLITEAAMRKLYGDPK